MGYREVVIRIAAGYTEDELKARIKKELGISVFTYQLEAKSLDARKRNQITWLIKAGVSSPELRGGTPQTSPGIEIPLLKTKEKVIIAGSGPAGFFSALSCRKQVFIPFFWKGAGMLPNGQKG